VRYPCRLDFVGIIKIIGLGNWDLENGFQLRRGVREIDVIFNGSQDRWADSYNVVLIGSIHTENLAVNPVGQGAEFILQDEVRV